MDLNLLLKRIDQLKEKLDNQPKFSEGEMARLREHFMIENTYHSNAIEGNTLTLHETRLVALEGLTIDKKPLREHLEVIGHRDAFEYIAILSQKNEVLTEREIKNIHSLVLMNDAQNKGIYRKIPVQITGALDETSDPTQFTNHMEQLLSNYHGSNEHPIKKISEFHLLFERIHPFIDGNGRTGRLILNLELMKVGYAPINVKYQD